MAATAADLQGGAGGLSGHGLVTLLKMVRERSERDDPRVIEFVDQVGFMAKSAFEAFDHLDEFGQILHGSKGVSAELDRPLKRMQDSLLLWAETRSVYRSWLDEIDRDAP